MYFSIIMQKTLFTLFFVLINFGFVKAQTNEIYSLPKNRYHSVFLELGGNAGLYSLNYEYKFPSMANTTFTLGSGFSYYPTGANVDGTGTKYSHLLVVTPAANLLFGRKSHFFEAGLSYMLLVNQTMFRLGYRYQSNKSGFLFRAGFTPAIGGVIGSVPWAGLSFGYSF